MKATNKTRYFIAAFGFLVSGSVAHASAVFINEIHYDNTGTDAGEAIEIAGPAGTNLTGWNLVLYNGATSTVYDTTALSGVIANQQNGFGTITFNYLVNGLQNGSPDGFALVDDSSSVVQFLSYEGSFTAANGPANGIMSVDIGVSESSSTPLGFSLQLRGTGTNSGDFVWEGPLSETLSGINTNQMFQEIGTKLVINEVDYDQDGTDTAEFIELFNAGSTAIDLAQYSMQFVNGANNTIYRTLALPDVSLASGDFFVICGDATGVANCDLDDDPSSNYIQNGAPDGLALLLGDVIVDALSYEGSVPGIVEGSGTGLIDDPALAFSGLSRFPNGADSNINNLDFSQRCITPGSANTAQSLGCVDPSAVPVPATLALIGLGLLGLARHQSAPSAHR